MGIFDAIRKRLGPRPPPGPPDPRTEALRRAQERRRARRDLRARDGKPMSARRLSSYERLERALVADAGAFPWTDAQARAALARRGFDEAHVAAYLASPAARRLLE